MADKLTDAELIERLKLHRAVGTTAGAKSCGVAVRAFQGSIVEAQQRGLSADSKVKDPIAELKVQNKLLKSELAAITRENDTAASIRQTIYDLSQIPTDPPKWLVQKRPKENSGIPMALWSDWHWGETVFSEQVGHANQFNRAIAKERLRKLVNITIDLAYNHMTVPEYPGIVVCLGGDMISGNIHEELRETNEGAVLECLQEVKNEIATALTLIADKFGRVFVPCVVGNHGRTTMKPRAKNRAFENYEWNLYCQLEDYFRHDKRFTFDVRGETDAYFTVLGHRFLLTHGDTLGVKGGDGIIGALGPIARGTFKVGRSEAQIGRDFDTLLMGHWHTYIPRGEAVPVIVNGTLKGYDEYARLYLRVPYSRPSQAFWFVHQKYGITAQWQIYLEGLKTTADATEWVTFQQKK